MGELPNELLQHLNRAFLFALIDENFHQRLTDKMLSEFAGLHLAQVVMRNRSRLAPEIGDRRAGVYELLYYFELLLLPFTSRYEFFF